MPSCKIFVLPGIHHLERFRRGQKNPVSVFMCFPKFCTLMGNCSSKCPPEGTTLQGWLHWMYESASLRIKVYYYKGVWLNRIPRCRKGDGIKVVLFAAAFGSFDKLAILLLALVLRCGLCRRLETTCSLRRGMNGCDESIGLLRSAEPRTKETVAPPPQGCGAQAVGSAQTPTPVLHWCRKAARCLPLEGHRMS